MKDKYRLRDGKIRIQTENVADAARKFLEYLWVLSVILNGNSVMHASATQDFHLLEICVGLSFVLLIVEFVFYKIHPTRQNVMLMLFILLYCTAYLSVMQTVMNAGVYIKLFLLAAPVMFLLFAELHRKGKLMDLMLRFVNVMCILAVISLVLWYLGVIVRVIPPNTFIQINWGAFSYIPGFFGIHYAIQLDTTFFPELFIYRNSGIFAEAPMYSMWLCIALALELFLREKPSRWRVVILAVTILTAMSVTGILFMAMCAVMSLMLNYRKISRFKKGLLLLGAMIAVPVVASLLIKSLSLKSDTQSFDMRLSDYVGGVRLWMDYPIFGAGFGNLKALLPYVYSPQGAIGFSNSIMAVLSTGGAWMAVFYYLPHVGLLIPKACGSKKMACFGICMMFLFCTTIFFARVIGVLLVVFGLAVITGCRQTESDHDR